MLLRQVSNLHIVATCVLNVIILQMYRVYRDPKGERYLDQNNPHVTSVNKITVTNESEEDYKKRIENLNQEIKVLNDKLEKVVAIAS